MPTRLAVAGCLLIGCVATAADPVPQSAVPIEKQPTDFSATKIALVAGFPAPKLKSGEHEYFAGCAILAQLLKQTPRVAPVIAKDGWAANPTTFVGTHAVVMFVEGGDPHSVLKGDRLKQLEAMAKGKVGTVFLHSAIDVPKDFGERMRSIGGAAWEKGFSQRAHWVATFDKFPDHPIMRGVTPFTIDDGWLWQLRFADGRTGITPLLRTVNPKATKPTTPDDAVVSWAYERPGGGRSFAFTGGHLHESLKNEGYRRFLVNGILWAAGKDIPAGGAPVALDAADLANYLDAKPGKK